MQRQNCLGGSPVDCSLCKWCLGKGQINVFQGRMEMQMLHLLAWECSAARRETSSPAHC